MKDYKIINKEEKNSELTLTIEIQKDFITKFRDKSIKNLGKEIEMKGFRKGMAPEKMIIEKVGEMKILEEESYQALYEVLPIIVSEEKIDALTSPKIMITKIAVGDDLEFKATFTLMPKIELPDYKKIAQSIPKNNKVEVTENEISDYINYIRKQKAESEYVKQKTSGEKRTESEEKELEKIKNQLPEFNDDFVKTLGDFKTVDQFKKQLHENMLADKKIHEQNKRRTEIIEKIIADSKIDLPEILIDEEKRRMLSQYRSDIERMRMNFEDYLKEIKKTEEDLKKDWDTDARKRAKMNLILPKIAAEEKITADQKKLEHELQHIREHHKDIDEQSAKFYLQNVLTNEAVFLFLENL